MVEYREAVADVTNLINKTLQATEKVILSGNISSIEHYKYNLGRLKMAQEILEELDNLNGEKIKNAEF